MSADRFRILVLGAGAMGSYFGASLAEQGFPVTLVDVNDAHLNAIVQPQQFVEIGEDLAKEDGVVAGDQALVQGLVECPGGGRGMPGGLPQGVADR